jgi:hypothetical protein
VQILPPLAPNLTFPARVCACELLDCLVDLDLHVHRVLIADGVLTQEVKLDVVGGNTLYVLNLRTAAQQSRKQMTGWAD